MKTLKTIGLLMFGAALMGAWMHWAAERQEYLLTVTDCTTEKEAERSPTSMEEAQMVWASCEKEVASWR